MASRDSEVLERFREKLDRELKSGLVSLVLLLVVDRSGPAYGYRILQAVQEHTGGLLAFKEGTAYPLLNNLEKMGLVASFWGTGAGGPPRKYYETTPLGKAALQQAMTDWQRLVANIDRLVERLETSTKEPPTDKMEAQPGWTRSKTT